VVRNGGRRWLARDVIVGKELTDER